MLPKANKETFVPTLPYVLRTFADIQAQEIRWIWTDLLARGKAVLVGGDPGASKTSLAMDWAARLTTGTPFPGESDAVEGEVVLLSYEDDPADTLLPRFLECGGDPTRMHLLDKVTAQDPETGDEKLRLFRLAEDMDALEALLTDRPEIRMVIVDPLNGYFGSGADSFKDNEVRDVIQPYIELARRRDVCIVLITHFTKTRGPVIHRFMGSVGFVGIARVALAVLKDPDDPERRVLLPAKNNIGRDDYGFAYRMEGDKPGVARPVYEETPLRSTAQEFAEQQDGEFMNKKERCEDWLKGLLADGPVHSDSIKRKAEVAGFSEATLNRAKARAGIRSYSEPGRGWYWHLKDGAA
jgi:hypothetical protein